MASLIFEQLPPRSADRGEKEEIMDNLIPPTRADVVTVQTTPRPTQTPVRVQFSDVLAGGAQALVQGAQAAVNALPGNPLAAVAVRGGASGVLGGTSLLGGAGSVASSLSVSTSPEGPGGVSATAGLANLTGVNLGIGGASAGSAGTTGTTGTTDPSIESSMAQSEQMNLYYLQIQEQVNAQNRTFTALSNVLEVEHSTAKSAIGNIH
jgi:hypothetical protein